MGRHLIEGVFDLLHFGHINVIYNAKQVSDQLCIGVNDDEGVEECKGFKPIYPYEERARLIAAVRFIDEFVGCIVYDVKQEHFDQWDYDALCHGSDVPIDFYHVLLKQNKLIVLPRTVGISSTNLIHRLLQASIQVAREDSEIMSIMEDSDIDINTHEILDYQREIDEKMGRMMEKFIEYHRLESLKDDIGRSFQMPQQSLVSSSNINKLCSNRVRSSSDKVVYVDGSFDLIHSGHIDMLEQTRELGTWTIIGLFDDESIRRMRGSRFPIISLIERAAVLLSMKHVDEVYFGTPWYLDDVFLSVVKPDVVIIREELLTNNHTFAIRTRSTFKLDPYEYLRSTDIQLVEPKMLLTISDIYQRVFNRKSELLPFIDSRLKKQENIQKAVINK